MITIDLTGKEKKHLYLVENLVKDTPHLGSQMWNTYETVAKIGLQMYANDKPTYQPVIHFFNEQAPHFDSNRPASIIESVSQSDALVAVGFAWSSMAGTASQSAEKFKMPYVSPTAVIEGVNEASHSVSLGASMASITKGFCFLYSKLEEPDLILVENKDQIHEREYANAIRSNVPNSKLTLFEYKSGDFPLQKISEALRMNEAKRVLVIIPGYTDLKDSISSILQKYPLANFLVGPQWSHDHKLLDLKGDVYCLSDYYNFLDTPLHREVTKKWHENGGGEILGGYLYSLFDALFYALKSLDFVENRDEVKDKIKTFGPFAGTKGNATVGNGQVNKEVYLLKYRYKMGFDLVKAL